MDIELKYLNDKHKILVDTYLNSIKEDMFDATEDYDCSKFIEYSQVLKTILLYSNNFYDSVEMKEAAIEEFAFLVPNFTFYMTVGFLTGLKRKDNEYDFAITLDTVTRKTQDVTGEIADMLLDERNKNNTKNKLKK